MRPCRKRFLLSLLLTLGALAGLCAQDTDIAGGVVLLSVSAQPEGSPTVRRVVASSEK